MMLLVEVCQRSSKMNINALEVDLHDKMHIIMWLAGLLIF